MKPAGVSYWSPAVDIASQVLGLLSRYRTQHQTLTEIATVLAQSKTTCLRVLKTLEAHRLVHYDERSRRYSLGIQALIIGARAEESLDYLTYLRPSLAELASRTDLTAVLIQQVTEDRMMYVAKSESSERTRVSISVGNRFPLTEVSYGRWVLAYGSADIREEILGQGLPQITATTVTDVAQIREILDTMRREHVLVSREEFIDGICAISSPVFRDDELIGVLAVLGVASTLAADAVNAVKDVVREIATAATRRLTTAGTGNVGIARETGHP